MNKEFLKKYMKETTETLRTQPKVSLQEMLKQHDLVMSGKPAKTSKPEK